MSSGIVGRGRRPDDRLPGAGRGAGVRREMAAAWAIRIPRDMLAGEFAFGKVEQRLETLERLHLPVPDSGE